MSAYKALLRPLLFNLPVDPETIHDWASAVLPYAPVRRSADRPQLAVSVAGLKFPSPIGMAAGFDKDCKFFPALYRFDFGSVEVGTITPVGQRGNPTPRIFRLENDDAIINRMGFPNDGVGDAVKRLTEFRHHPGPLGVNIGANKDSSDKVADYVKGLKSVAAVADYVTINVSSPNTPGLRELESGDNLSRLLDALEKGGPEASPPIFLKVSPDLTASEIEAAANVLVGSKISGVIVGNTTLARPETLRDRLSHERGGLSGRPLSSRSCQALDFFHASLKGALPIISVGGIFSAEDAYDRIKRGASLVQIYTGFIYEGPFVVRRMNKRLCELLADDGLSNIEHAIGVGAKRANSRTAKKSGEMNGRPLQPAIA